MKAARENIRVQRWVAGVSVIILLTKFFAYYLTHSVSILGDALESIVNVVAGFFGLYSLQLSAKPRDVEHPYGHGKIEFISAAVEGVMIAFASVYILVEAVRNLINPVSLTELDLGILLIGGTGVINFALGRWCVATGKRNKSVALLASGRHLLADTYTTVGIFLGLILIYVTGVPWIDSVVAILFAGIIFLMAFKIIRGSVAGIMDERDRDLLEEMVQALDRERSKNWIDLHNIRIIKYGSTLHLDCHVTLPWYLNVHEAHEEVEKIEQIVRREFGDAIELFVHADGCIPLSCPICIKDDCPVRHHSFQKRIRWTVENIERNEKHSETTTND